MNNALPFEAPLPLRSVPPYDLDYILYEAAPEQPTSQTITEQRHMIGRALLANKVSGDPYDAVLLGASELTTNALRRRMLVSITVARIVCEQSRFITIAGLLVAVRDTEQGWTAEEGRLPRAGETGETSRGLAIVRSISAACGYEPGGAGKTVWMVVPSNMTAPIFPR